MSEIQREVRSERKRQEGKRGVSMRFKEKSGVRERDRRDEGSEYEIQREVRSERKREGESKGGVSIGVKEKSGVKETGIREGRVSMRVKEKQE